MEVMVINDMLGCLSADIIGSKRVFQECSSRKTVSFEVNSENIHVPNGGYCVYYPSNFQLNTRGFENWGISRDAFRPIACERIYLMDYNRA